MYRLFSRFKVHDEFIYAVMNDACYVEEFSYDELRLLDRFIHIVGVQEQWIDVAVYIASRIGDTYEVASWVTWEKLRCESRAKVERKMSEGYLYGGKGANGTLNLFNPGIAIRLGVKAIVTDRGNLLYCRAFKNNVIVLGDFCKRVCDFSLRGDSGVTYVFDNRIEWLGDQFYENCSGVINCDVTNARPEIKARLYDLHYNNIVSVK